MDLSSVLDALPVAVVAVDAAGEPVHLNACARDLLAGPGGDPDRERLQGALRLDGGEREDVVALALHVTRPVGVPVTVVTHRGLLSRRALLARWGPGAVIAFRGLVADSGAGEAEAQLEALLANTADIVTVLEADGRIRYANPSASRLTGYDGALVHGAQVLDLVHPDDRPTVEATIAAAGEHPGTGETIVLRVRFADDSWHVVEAVVNNLLDDPAVGGLVVTVHDITDTVREEQRFRSLVANLSDVIVVLDADLQVTYASPAIERLLGGAPETNLGLSALNDIHPDDLPAVVALLQDALTDPGSRRSSELRMRHNTGVWRRVEGTVVNLLHDPSVEGLVCTLRDVTDEREALERLRELDRVKDQFLLTLSHELRTPLAAISGFTELLADDAGRLDPARRAELLDRVARNATELHAMVERLLDHARLATGEVTLAPEPLDLRGAVDAAVTELGWPGGTHEVAVAVAPGLRVLADPHGVAHVLRNLLGNAAKFSPPGTTVTVAAAVEAGDVVVTVADQGPGLDADEAARVFEPFFQSEPTRGGRRGTGVGLAVARRYVELQGGRIGVRAVPGAGATFWFSLPLAP